MKLQYLFILLVLCLNIDSIKTATTCIQGQNCPNRQGFCIQNECVCVYGFQTLLEIQNTSNPIYCNYRQKNRFVALFLEFFLPPSGLFYLGRIGHAIFKLLLIITMCFGRFTFIYIIFFVLQIIDLFKMAFGFILDGYGIPIL